jgi:hypothetical protein
MKVYSKVQGMTLAGAIVAVMAWALESFAGIALPTEVVSALIVVVGFVIGYFTPERVGSG